MTSYCQEDSLLQGIFPTQGLNPGLLHCRWILYSLHCSSSEREFCGLQGKPKNTKVGSLSLLQQISPTQKLNQDLLHCRQILYRLSYQGSPVTLKVVSERTCMRNSSKNGVDIWWTLRESSLDIYFDFIEKLGKNWDYLNGLKIISPEQELLLAP